MKSSREPTRQEIQDLVKFIWTAQENEYLLPRPRHDYAQSWEERVVEIATSIRQARIAVYDQGQSEKYVGRVMIVCWQNNQPIGRNAESVFMWKEGEFTLADPGQEVLGRRHRMRRKGSS